MLVGKEMKRILFVLFCYIPFMLSAQLFQSEPLVRVRIINTLDTLMLTTDAGWFLQDKSSQQETPVGSLSFQVTQANDSLRIQFPDSVFQVSPKGFRLSTETLEGSLGIADVPYGVGWWWGGQENRSYEGDIHIYLDSLDDLCVTVHLPLETYLKGVVPYEIGGDAPLEALKAQAVSARSEAIIALTSKMYSGEFHDLTSDVECQVFSGNHKRTAASDQAVEETRALVISEHGKPINAYYASNCGGHSELIENVWPKRPRPASYRVAREDNSRGKTLNLGSSWRFWRWVRSSPKVNCNPELNPSLPVWSKRNFRWERSFGLEEISDMISPDSSYGLFKKLRVLERGPSGRIYKAVLVFEAGQIQVDGELALRQLFNPSLRSSAFKLKKRGGRVVLNGTGWGHGVGMCQSGARSLATQGVSFGEILNHYYSRAKLLEVYPLD